ncbi:hypothetical protein [Methylocella sp.]|jgi:hypothetical protein|uniref:hypothetical protein n=1 Tax=Methylocella sp. TaxID=1978226 RepID=UPI003C167937
MIEVLTVEGWNGERQWRRVGEVDHVTRDGRSVKLAQWESACTICGGPFHVTTPAAACSVERTKSFTVATCPAHRLTQSERAKIRYSPKQLRADVFESIKRAKLASEATQ